MMQFVKLIIFSGLAVATDALQKLRHCVDGNHCDEDKAQASMPSAVAISSGGDIIAITSRGDTPSAEDETSSRQRTGGLLAGDGAKAEAARTVNCSTWDGCKKKVGVLEYHIFTPSTGEPWPVVVAHHGAGGGIGALKGLCQYILKPAGYACVTIHPIEDAKTKGSHTDAVLKEMIDNADMYGIDVDNFFMYGYSAGGHSQLYYMMESLDPNRDRVKGVISDCSSPGDSKFNWKEKRNGKYVTYPPYFMIHCEQDPQMKPQWSVDKSVKNIAKANEKRKTKHWIYNKYMKFLKATDCKHKSLVQYTEEGKSAALNFMENIMSGKTGDEVFHGVEDEVSSKPASWEEPLWKQEKPPPNGGQEVWIEEKKHARCKEEGDVKIFVAENQEACQDAAMDLGYGYYSFREYDKKCLPTEKCDIFYKDYWFIMKLSE